MIMRRLVIVIACAIYFIGCAQDPDYGQLNRASSYVSTASTACKSLRGTVSCLTFYRYDVMTVTCECKFTKSVEKIN